MRLIQSTSDHPDKLAKDEAERWKRNEQMNKAVLEKEPNQNSEMFFNQKKGLNDLKKLEKTIDTNLKF